MNLVRVSDNKFAAIDDAGNKVGTASIRRLNLERIFEDRPLQYEINVECSEEAKVLLYSAAVTRARVLTESAQSGCRVYCVLEPEDVTGLEIVRTLGLRNYDGIVRMRKPVDVKGCISPLPAGFTRVNDFLNNAGEFNRCLKRYNECFARSEKAAWLEDLLAEDNFIRMMVVNDRGLCGELLAWSRGDTGVIGVIQTARPFRRQGIASVLIEDARLYFLEKGMRNMSFDVWRASPGCLRLAESAGYTSQKIIALFPEMV